MKKITLDLGSLSVRICCLSLISFCASVHAMASTTKNLWAGTHDVANWSALSIPEDGSSSDAVKALKAGDVIQITTSSYQSGASIWLQDNAWSQINGSADVTPSGTTTQLFVNKYMAAVMQRDGVVRFTGHDYVISSVDIISPENYDSLDTYLWTGHVATGNWSKYQAVPAACFADAAVGDKLRINISEVNEDAQGYLNTSKWADFPDATGVALTADMKYYEFAITQNMLTELQSNGVIVKGKNYTLTAVRVIGNALLPSAIQTKTDESVSYSLVDHVMTVYNAPVGSTIRVSTVSGVQTASYRVTASSTSVLLAPQTVNLIRVDGVTANKTLKVCTK